MNKKIELTEILVNTDLHKDTFFMGLPAWFSTLLHEVGHAVHLKSRQIMDRLESSPDAREAIADDVAQYIALRLGAFPFAIALHEKKRISIEKHWKSLIDQHIKTTLPLKKRLMMFLFYKPMLVRVCTIPDYSWQQRECGI